MTIRLWLPLVLSVPVRNISEFVDLNRLGAVVTKGVANVPWPGNPTPRIAESIRRHAQCHWSAEPGYRCVCVKRHSVFEKI